MIFRWLTLALVALAIPAAARADTIVVDFEDLTLPPGSFYNGADGAGGFGSGGASFRNSYNPTWGTWSGWSYSNRGDTTTPGFSSQYGSFAGGDASGDGIFGVAFGSGPSSTWVDLPEFGPGLVPSGISAQFTNTTYAALSMLLGDQFAKEFGGATGDDADYFLLTIVGFAGLGATGDVIDEVPFYLADYRFADNGLDYVVGDWQAVDLTTLLGARSLGFRLTSSDVGDFGMNTPAYFAMDDLTFTFTVIPEPASLAMFGVGLVAVAAVAVRRRRLAN